MLAALVLKTIQLLKIYRKEFKIFLLICATISLYLPKIKYEIMSQEYLFEDLEFTENFLTDFPKEYQPNLPNKTILIICDTNDPKVIKFIEDVKRMKIRTKSIEFSRFDSSEQYFIKINLIKSDKTHLKINPFKNFQPNSDLVYIASKMLGYKLYFSFSDLFWQKFDNILNIKMDFSEQSSKKVLEMIRIFMNLETHAYGLYYYIPLGTNIIRAESCVFLIVIMLIYAIIFDNQKSNILNIIFSAIFYAISPLTMLYSLKTKDLVPKIIIFSVINFKAGFCFCFLYYITCIYRIVFSSSKTLKVNN